MRRREVEEEEDVEEVVEVEEVEEEAGTDTVMSIGEVVSSAFKSVVSRLFVGEVVSITFALPGVGVLVIWKLSDASRAADAPSFGSSSVSFP